MSRRKSPKPYKPSAQTQANQRRARNNQQTLWTPDGVGDHYERSDERKRYGQ